MLTSPSSYSGNLSMRSLADVVSASDFSGTNDSEYLETILVAVPKYAFPSPIPTPDTTDSRVSLLNRNITKEWEASYERLTQMVVPRSSTYVCLIFHQYATPIDKILRPSCRKLAEDEEYVLYSVTIFRRIKDEFSQKAREKK